MKCHWGALTWGSRRCAVATPGYGRNPLQGLGGWGGSGWICKLALSGTAFGCRRCWRASPGVVAALDPRLPSVTLLGSDGLRADGLRSDGLRSNGLRLDGPASVVPGSGGVCAGPVGSELVYADGFHLPLIVPCACVPGDDEFLARWADEPWCVDTLPGPLGRAGGRAGPLGRTSVSGVGWSLRGAGGQGSAKDGVVPDGGRWKPALSGLRRWGGPVPRVTAARRTLG